MSVDGSTGRENFPDEVMVFSLAGVQLSRREYNEIGVKRVRQVTHDVADPFEGCLSGSFDDE